MMILLPQSIPSDPIPFHPIPSQDPTIQAAARFLPLHLSISASSWPQHTLRRRLHGPILPAACAVRSRAPAPPLRYISVNLPVARLAPCVRSVVPGTWPLRCGHTAGSTDVRSVSPLSISTVHPSPLSHSPSSHKGKIVTWLCSDASSGLYLYREPLFHVCFSASFFSFLWRLVSVRH
ncbi:hypothetical protein BKA56DRAFT_24772 [Ilyonectria sp. MPI-CAGE-AT-0026]|nr:hypothetical protein BKA56DRAFT_24772 [Ilyonectria sp. MPI-CAGE-AT-0026]